MSTRPTDRVASLLPPASTALERDLEQTTARATEVPTPFDTLWDADTCPAHLLGWLAWALSVDEWDPTWPEAVKRESIRIAPKLHQRKGTVWAVENALKALGTTSNITEWFAMRPMGEPGTFRIITQLSDPATGTAQGPVLTPDWQQKIRAVVDRAKPASRSYSTRIGLTLNVRHREVAALRPAIHAHISMVPTT